jgi:predicted RNA-binding protein (virulence factor B family)
MLQNGRWHILKYNRQSPHGWYLIDNDLEEVLLPNKYCPEKIIIGQEVRVFIYRDSQERLVATSIKPLLELNQFGVLDIVGDSPIGAFADIGLEKHILIPFKEQHERLRTGDQSIVYLYLDEASDRLVGSARVNRWLDNEPPSYKKGEKVALLVYHQNEVGYQVIVDQRYRGIIYENELFENIQIGDQLEGYVRVIREGGLIDISHKPLGRSKNSQYENKVLQVLKENNGFIPLNDKADPQEIQRIMQMSKRSFKEAIGGLYRKREIEFFRDGIRLTG